MTSLKRTTSPSCPICWKSMTSRNRVELECHHIFCRICAQQWIIAHSTCPFCRRRSYYYDRVLRSTRQGMITILEFVITIRMIEMEEYDSQIQYLNAMTECLEEYILREKKYWYRIMAFRELQRILRYFILDNIPYIETLIASKHPSPLLQPTLKILHQMKSFLQF